MKLSNKIKILIVGLAVTVTVSKSAIAEINIPSWVLPAAIKLATSQDDVFYNFHLDNVDYTPVKAGRLGAIRTNFFSSFLPFTWGNLSLKLKIFNDKGVAPWMPQVDLVGGYGRIIALDLAGTFLNSGDDEDSEDGDDDDSGGEFIPPTFMDYSAGILLTKAVSKQTRLYTGFHYSVIQLDFEFPDPIELNEAVKFENITVDRIDYILVTGISNIINENKRVVAYLGYGFNYKKIFSRFSWSYDHVELGFNIYPEGLLVIHPFLGWHWYF